MKITLKSVASIAVMQMFIAGAVPVMNAQEMNPTSGPQSQKPLNGMPVGTRNGEPLYKIEVVARNLPAVNYKHRSDSTHIGFEGTSLLPQAKGEAKVQSERGKMVIDAKFQGLKPANSFGPEYLTYVLWAITPDGSPRNLGEILPDGTKNNISVTTDLQTFGLIVTAEPYYAVTQPSDVVVLQNVILDKTQGVIEQVNAHYNLLPRGAYTEIAGGDTVLHPITRDMKSPLELYEAQNALQLAKLAGADKYSPSIMAQAQQNLSNAEDMNTHKGDKKQEISFAREAVERAEDARINSLRKQQELRRQKDVSEKQDAQLQAQESAMQAQQSAMQAQQAAMQKAQADADRARAEAAAAEARAQAAQSQQVAKQATDQTAEMREKLRAQLNNVLQTSETARGLIVNMSDVLFDTGKYTLKPATREMLSKVSGILLAYPGLKLQVEGYTDNVGGAEFNQKLSEERASTVRDYLVSQSVSMNNISAAGFGLTDPVADNATASGRAQNRRVQLVVSGSAIGITASSPNGGTGGGN